jgi:ribonuclease R
MAFGFVHIHSLKDDIYRLNDSATELRGRRTNQVFKVGDKVKLKVESVDIFKRQIDFVLAETTTSYSKRSKNRKRRR